MRASMMALGAAGIMAVTTLAATAMDNMMVDKGMTIMVMPDGKMASMKAMDEKMMSMMKDKAKPMDKAVIMMMGTDGKMYMMEDTMMPDGKMASDSMMMMAK
jgi:hypothetical protein